MTIQGHSENQRGLGGLGYCFGAEAQRKHSFLQLKITKRLSSQSQGELYNMLSLVFVFFTSSKHLVSWLTLLVRGSSWSLGGYRVQTMSESEPN